jgi:hypothetical protein
VVIYSLSVPFGFDDTTNIHPGQGLNSCDDPRG